jgi:hypothetical protein
MLISMPTGTSTIFGVFQAIWLSLNEQDELRPRGYKLVRIKNFASEIFRGTARGFMVQRKRNSRDCAAKGQTKAGSTGSYSPEKA